MKTVNLLNVVLLVVFVSSCTSYYYVCTDVSDNLDVERRIYAYSSDGTSADFPFETAGKWTVSQVEKPFEVDFYDVQEKMTHVAERAGRIEDVSLTVAGGSNPLLRPSESLGRRFRWFYTYYDYVAVFEGLDEMLPLPLEGYLTDQQQEVFFRGGTPPEGWNGVEMYYLLDSVNQSFSKWYSDAVYFVMCDIFGPYCTAQQKTALDTLKGRFMDGVGNMVMFAMKPEEFEDRLAAVLPDSGFGSIYEQNREAIDQAYEKESEVIDCFDTAFIYSVNMPGKCMAGNAVDLVGGYPAWKIDSYRLMCGDLKLIVTSRKANLWAFLITFAAIAAFLQAFAKVFTRRPRS